MWEGKMKLKKTYIVNHEKPVLGKRILKIISNTRKQREVGKPFNAFLQMTDYVCEVRFYLRFPEKKIRPFSSISKASIYEKSDDVAAMAVAAAYRDIYGTDVYMVDGDRYGTELFLPKTPEGIEAWDNALMAISGDSGIRDKTIYNLMISSYAKACFANVARIKETMLNTVDDKNVGTDSKKDLYKTEGEIVQLILDIQKNNELLHSVYPQTKWFTGLMESEAIAVKYEIEHISSVDMIVASTFDTERRYAYIGSVLIDPNIFYCNGYNVMTMNNESGDLFKEIVCPMRGDFKDMIIKMVKGTLER